MWQEENKLALKAFMDGQETEAIERWRKTLMVAEKEETAQCFELGQVNYYLGKALCDCKFDDAGIPYLQRAIEIISSVDADHEQLTKAKYDLACAYRRINEEGKATALFTDALKLGTKISWISLTDAVKNLHKQMLARELKDEELKRVCDRLKVDRSGSNSCIADLLYLYYTDEKDSKQRAEADKYFCADGDDYDIQDVVDTLSKLIGKSGKIKIVGAATCPRSPDNFDLELNMDGEDYYQQVSCVDHVVWAFNTILESIKSKSRFQRIDEGTLVESSYLLLKESTLEKLTESNTLKFIDCENYD